ncbi:MAG: YaaR family protein [Syntrophomonadaceae bacterium]|nr:YaaR family protein [Syntrophomonadaceae bacterium]
MKINRNKRGIKSYISSLEKMNIKEIKKRSDSSFEQEINKQKETEDRRRMQEIIAKIDRISQKLNKSLTINDLMVYKKLVQDFLQEAASRAFLLRQERGRNRRGRTLLVTIDIIDSEVEQLIKDFISEKKKPWEILSAIDKIRGMLVDLMV